MFSNPFTPVFGGKPHFFFGRQDILARFERAMVDQGSEDRALFITGTRGNGKTALLEQLSQRAQAKGRTVVDLGSENTVELLVRNLVRHDEETRTVSPQASVSVLGTGAGISAGGVAKTTRYTTADLQMLFTEKCEKLKHGLLVTIDEVQKVPEPDLTAICDAFQMASRKGLDVMLAVAGLPFAHPQIVQYQGCTYLQRSVHEEIGLFTHEEARRAFSEALLSIEGLKVGDDALDGLVAASFGHPYLMQLLGYYLVAALNDEARRPGHLVSADDVERIIPYAVDAYERRALAPMLDELTRAEREYLSSMAATIGDLPSAKSAAVAEAMGKTAGNVSRLRDTLLRLGIIEVPERGSLVFAIPLLRQYLGKEPPTSRTVARVLEWGL